MRPLSRWFARPRTILALLLVGAIVAGAELPSLRLGPGSGGPPLFSITIRHFGMDAAEIETGITIPLEEALTTLGGIDHIRCSSEYGKCSAELALSRSADPNRFYLSLRDAVNALSAVLPRSVQRPEIASSGSGRRPILIAAVAAEGLTIDQTHQWAARIVRPVLERIDGVGEVEVAGGSLSEIRVEVDRGRAASAGLSLPEIARQIRDASLLRPVGRIQAGRLELPIVVSGRLASLEQLASLPVVLGGSRSLRLADLADARFRPREVESISRIDGERRVTLSIMGSGEAKTVAASKGVRQSLSSLATPGIAFTIVYDLGAQIASSLSELLRSILIATGAVSLFVALALRPFRNALLLTLLVPAVVVFSLALLTAFGITIDPYVLAGIAVGIGLVVDPGVVVLSALRARRGGAGPDDTAGVVNGVAPPLGASAATTLIVLLPLIALCRTVPELAGITSALLVVIPSSLLLALLFLPAFAVRGSRPGCRPPAGRHLVRTVRRCLFAALLCSMARPWPILAAAGGVCIAGVVAALRMDLALSSPADARSIYAHIELESGTEIATVDRRVTAIAREVLKTAGVRHVETVARRENAALMVVLGEGGAAAVRARRALLELSHQQPGAFLYIPAGDRSGGQSAEVGVVGPDEAVLRSLATQTASELQAVDWVEQVVLNFKPGPPQLLFTPDHRALAERGVSAEAAAETLRWGIYGPVALKWLDPLAGEMDLRVSGAAAERGSLASVATSLVLSPKNRAVELSQLGSFRVSFPPARLYRFDRQRSLSFTIHSGLRSARTLLGRLEASLRSRGLPIGYAFRIDPDLYRRLDEARSAALLLIVAAVMVFTVIAAETESLTAPLLVMTIVPLSLSVPLIALWLARSGIDLSVLISLVLMQGIVVNNAILVLDRVLRRSDRVGEGSGDEVRRSLLYSIRHRSRALFVTSAASVVSLIPLLAGSTTEPALFRSLALVMLIGTLASLLATFFVLPALASLLPAFARRLPRVPR